MAWRRLVKFHYNAIPFHCLSLWPMLDNKVQHQIYPCKHRVIQSILASLKAFLCRFSELPKKVHGVFLLYCGLHSEEQRCTSAVPII